MVQSLGCINSREVIYLTEIDNVDLRELLPKQNWLLLAVANKSELPLAEEFAQTCLDSNVLYICGAGEAASEIDDLFDCGIVSRKIAEDSEDYSDAPTTSFETKIDEQLWYSAYTCTCD